MAQEEINKDFRNGIYFNPLGLWGLIIEESNYFIQISYERELKNRDFLMVSPRLWNSLKKLSGTGVEVQYRFNLRKRSIDPDIIYHIPTSIIYFAPYTLFDIVKEVDYKYYGKYYFTNEYISRYSFGIVFGMKSSVFQFPNYKNIVTLDIYIGGGIYYDGYLFLFPKIGIQIGVTF